MPLIQNKNFGSRELCRDNVGYKKWPALLTPFCIKLLTDIANGWRVTGAENLLAEMAVMTDVEHTHAEVVSRLYHPELRGDALKKLAADLQECGPIALDAFVSSIEGTYISVIESPDGKQFYEVSLCYNFDGESRDYLPQMFYELKSTPEQALGELDDILVDKAQGTAKPRYYYGIKFEPMAVSFGDAKKEHMLNFGKPITVTETPDTTIFRASARMGNNRQVAVGQILSFRTETIERAFQQRYIAVKPFNLSLLAFELAKSHEKECQQYAVENPGEEPNELPQLGIFTELFAQWLEETDHVVKYTAEQVSFDIVGDRVNDRINPDNVTGLFGGLI